jgi:hypothetical protein
MLTFALLAGCRHAPDETRVRDAIAATAHAAEQGDASGVVGVLSEDFDGNAGTLDRKSLGNLVRLTHLRGDRISVVVGPVDTERRGDRLLARFTVTLGAGSGALPDQLGIYSVETAWRLEGREWRCYSASWKQSL